ncbi:MAG: LysM peptidoglycan-binding domain-containing protein [Thermodesulfobacteriota bacterium]
MVSLFFLAAGCQSPPPDENSEDTAARLKRLETRVATLELSNDVYNERNKKFERFMEESERRHSELLVRMSKLHENSQGNAPATGTAPAADSTGTVTLPAPDTGKKAPAADRARYHLVQKSDTIYSISRQYDLEPAALKKMNNLTEDVIVPGQKLRVK